LQLKQLRWGTDDVMGMKKRLGFGRTPDLGLSR
jgi:hypothetical protein